MPRADAVGAGRDTDVPAVHLQRGLRGVAIGFDVDDAVGAVNIATPGEMKRGAAVPIRTIEIERVLPDRALIADETLLVDICEITLSAVGTGEIEHVPDEFTPQIGTAPELHPGLLVVVALKFLRMWPAVGIDAATQGIVAVVSESGASAIFRHCNREG